MEAVAAETKAATEAETEVAAVMVAALIVGRGGGAAEVESYRCISIRRPLYLEGVRRDRRDRQFRR